jgi:hypothetical protein
MLSFTLTMEKVPQWGASKFVRISRYYWADKIKENKVGGACGTHGRGEKLVQGFGGKDRRKKTTRKNKA